MHMDTYYSMQYQSHIVHNSRYHTDNYNAVSIIQIIQWATSHALVSLNQLNKL